MSEIRDNRSNLLPLQYIKLKLQFKFTLELAKKAQWGSRGTALLSH
jgi:hypothetical protein